MHHVVEVYLEDEVAVDGDGGVEESGLIAVKDAELQIKLAKVIQGQIQIKKSEKKKVIQMKAPAVLVNRAQL